MNQLLSSHERVLRFYQKTYYRAQNTTQENEEFQQTWAEDETPLLAPSKRRTTNDKNSITFFTTSLSKRMREENSWDENARTHLEYTKNLPSESLQKSLTKGYEKIQFTKIGIYDSSTKTSTRTHLEYTKDLPHPSTKKFGLHKLNLQLKRKVTKEPITITPFEKCAKYNGERYKVAEFPPSPLRIHTEELSSFKQFSFSWPITGFSK